jgi:hypothetical protein
MTTPASFITFINGNKSRKVIFSVINTSDSSLMNVSAGHYKMIVIDRGF